MQDLWPKGDNPGAKMVEEAFRTRDSSRAPNRRPTSPHFHDFVNKSARIQLENAEKSEHRTTVDHICLPETDFRRGKVMILHGGSPRSARRLLRREVKSDCLQQSSDRCQPSEAQWKHRGVAINGKIITGH